MDAGLSISWNNGGDDIRVGQSVPYNQAQGQRPVDLKLLKADVHSWKQVLIRCGSRMISGIPTDVV